MKYLKFWQKYILIILVFVSYFVLVQETKAEQTLVTLTATESTFIRSQFPNSNYGTADIMYAERSDTNESRAFFKFDLSSIPQGATIVSIYISLYF